MSRRFSRPRTKMYDCNYRMGEAAYKSTLDSLDNKKCGRLSTSASDSLNDAAAPRARPMSMGDLDSVFSDETQIPSRTAERAADRIAERAANMRIEEKVGDDMTGLLSRIKKAREEALSGPTEANFENAFSARRTEVKQKLTEKVLDSVGISAIADDDFGIISRKARTHMATLEEPAWPSLPDAGANLADELAARARARRSRARIAAIDNELDEIAARGAARDRRAQALRQMLSDDQDSFKVVKKVTLKEKLATAVY